MSNNQSWVQRSGAYFSDNPYLRWGVCGVMLLLAFMVLWNYMPKAHERNMVINQGDIVQHKGMSKEIADFRKAHDHKEPLWTSAMFSGMPTYQISTWYPNNLMQRLDNVMNLRGLYAEKASEPKTLSSMEKILNFMRVPHPIGSLFLLFVGMFFLLKTLRVDPFSAAVGAFGFMMCSYYFSVLDAGHNSKVNAVAYMPFVLAGVLLLYRGRFWLGSAVTILAMGLEINANHFQITYYGFFIIGAIVLSEFSRNLNKLGKGITWTAFASIFISWMIGLPRIIWIIEALILFGVPLVMAILTLQKEGNSIKAWFTGKGLTTNAKPVRTFVVATLLMVVCMGISIAPNISRLMTTSEYVKETMRGGPVHPRAVDPLKPAQSGETSGLSKEYAYTWSYGMAESFTIINPFYFGDAVHADLGENSETYEILASGFGPQGAKQLSAAWPVYIGDQPMHGGPTYMGVVVSFLFILGLFVVPTRHRWWLLAAALVSLMLSWGRNFQWFSDLFFDNLPYYNNFRAVSMWLTITSICMSIMGGLALAAVFRNSESKTPVQQAKIVGIAGGITIFILLVLAWFNPGADLSPENDAGKIANFLMQVGVKNPDSGLVARLADALPGDRAALITSQAYKGILLTLIAAGALIGYIFLRKEITSKDTRSIVIGGVCMILFGLIYWDMVPVDKRYLSDDSFIRESELLKPFTPSATDVAIKRDPDPNYRVLNLTGNTWNDAMTSYHHKSIGGYSAVKMQRYQDLIDFRFDQEKEEIFNALSVRDSTQMQRIQDALKGVTALNMLNCKYMILDPGGMPLPNSAAMGHAWTVANFEVVDGATRAEQAEKSMAKLEGLDLRGKMIVEKNDASALDGFQPALDPAATIKLISWQSNELKYQFSSTSGKEQLVAFSEVYYNSGKGWQAYIDGQPAEHFRCNYILRGMRVPSGNHEIIFRMEPKSYARGEQLALIFSVLLFLIAIGAVIMDFRSGRKDDETSPDGSTVDKKV